MPHDQTLGVAVFRGLLLGILGQFTSARGGCAGCAEGHIHIIAAQFRGEGRCDLQDDIQLVLRGLVYNGGNGNRGEERSCRTIVHRSETSLRSSEVQDMLLLERLYIHRGVVVHIIYKHSTEWSFTRTTTDKVVIEGDMKTRTTFQLIADKYITLDCAVDEISLYIIIIY